MPDLSNNFENDYSCSYSYLFFKLKTLSSSPMTSVVGMVTVSQDSDVPSWRRGEKVCAFILSRVARLNLLTGS